MAGNQVWGAGHHQGFGEGRGQGQKEGGAVVAAIVTIGTALYLVGKWGYGKYQGRQSAEQGEDMPPQTTNDENSSVEDSAP